MTRKETTTGWLRGFAVTAMACVMGIACTPKPDPARGRTSDEIQQLINVTDSAVRLTQSLSDGERDFSEVQAAVRPVVAAIDTASTQMRRHFAATQSDNPYVGDYPDDRFDALAYSDVASCVTVNNIEFLGIERHIEKLNDARLKGDERTIELRRAVLLRMSQKAIECASLATENLRAAKDVNTVEHIGILIGDIYAIATALHTVTGLRGPSLLKRQIASNESIVARLEPRCKRQRTVAYPCVSYKLAVDALPKLTAALPRLTTERTLQPAHAERTLDEIRQLTELTDSAVTLMTARPRAEEPSSKLDTAIRQTTAAIHAAESPLQRQAAESQIDNIVDAMTYAKTRACVESNVILFTGSEPFMHRLNEARLKGDGAAIKARRIVFQQFTLESSRCYFDATAFFTTFYDLKAVNNMGIVISEIYAITTAFQALGGLTRGGELAQRNLIEANAVIVNRLAPRCEKRQRSGTPIVEVTDPCAAYRLAMDALPKLRTGLVRPTSTQKL